MAGAARPESIETAAGKAYYTIENARDGSTSVRRYSMILSGGIFTGYVAAQIPENAARIYTDDAVRQMFASAVTRKDVPVEEQLSLLPFKITDLGSFKSVHTLAPGAAVLLSDGDGEAKIEAASFMVIGTIASAPTQPGDRDRFAQQAAATIPGLRDASDHDVRTGPHRWITGLRNPPRCLQRQGKGTRHRGAVAAIRQCHFDAANHR